MKKLTITLLLLTVGVSTMFAQRRGSGPSEKIEAFRVAFFTQKLDLTESESQAFWPIYNAYQKDLRLLRQEQKTYIKPIIRKCPIKNFRQ
ncbi:MAG: hypothetical protein HC803_01320 [Saprospiraceae bacterium]|nr:hypothetical protein [Saprospiraceae bacterium]